MKNKYNFKKNKYRFRKINYKYNLININQENIHWKGNIIIYKLINKSV